jgi:hypothetical protein
MNTVSRMGSADLIGDELERVVSMLCSKYPDRTHDEIAALVSEVYRQLASKATVTTHLIPLTVNRCRQALTSRPDVEQPAALIGSPT